MSKNTKTVSVPPDVVDTMVSFRGVHKYFGHLHVLKGVDLDIRKSEICVLIGPSGSGKSTVLRCISQPEEISADRVHFDGQLLGLKETPVPSSAWQLYWCQHTGALTGHDTILYQLPDKAISTQRERIGMVFQRFNLFPHKTALENVMGTPVRVARIDRTTARKEALDLLAQVGLADRLNHYPAQFSGDRQWRVVVARALAMKPGLILSDEPTSTLDPELVGEVLQVMRDLAHRGMTVMVVTHEVGFVREVGRRVAFMDGGQVIEMGSPAEMLDHPQEARTQEFISKAL